LLFLGGHCCVWCRITEGLVSAWRKGGIKAVICMA